MAAVLLMLFLVILSQADAQKTPSYFKLGDKLVLRPSFSGTISSIVWKFKGNLAAEWTAGSVDLTYYASFKGRTTLNPETGELVINNMRKDDSGEFVVEINNKVQEKTFESVGIKDVPEPEVNLRPVTCDSTSSSCRMLCDGDIKESGPVTFYWRKGDGEWKESQQVMNIAANNEETKRIKMFSCRMKNPVSGKESQAVKNPFYQETKGRTPGGASGGTSGGASGGTSGGAPGRASGGASGGAGWVLPLLALSFGGIF